MSNAKKMLLSAAGNAGGAGLDITEVFSTYLYTGNGGSLAINNGIDLDGEGGLTWFKTRPQGNHNLMDTERGNTKYLRSNTGAAEGTNTNYLTSFNSNGFTLGNSGTLNGTQDYVSWTFRKAPKFFDCVTWTGNNASNRAISHNLDCVPGMIIVARRNAGEDWGVWHKDVHENTSKVLYLNQTVALATSTQIFGASNPTDANFYVGEHPVSNNDGDSYVAYLFAHNNNDGEFGPDSDQDIIKCGTIDGNQTVDLGFEPQWVMIKRYDAAGNWYMLDTMRGMPVGSDNANMYANRNNAEAAGGEVVRILPNGLQSVVSANHIYMAIRRGPLAPPEAATEVFKPLTYTASGQAGNKQTTGFPVDLAIFNIAGSDDPDWTHGLVSRLTGGLKYLSTNSTAAEASVGSSGVNFDDMTGYDFEATPFNNNGAMYNLNWKRAPGYFDVVCYTGNGSASRTVSHNLGVAPEMMWVKCRSATESWAVYHKKFGGTHFARLNQTGAFESNGNVWDNTDTTASVFTVDTDTEVNTNGQTYIAYLFASVAGISKVGSVSHSGTTNVDCGFSNGARFVILKRTDATGDWYAWNSATGIIAGNDPYRLLNTTAGQVTNTDFIDPLNAGFTISDNFTDGDYIFYAIA